MPSYHQEPNNLDTLIYYEVVSKYLSIAGFMFYMEFRELSDSEWELIRPFLPPRLVRGKRPMVDFLNQWHPICGHYWLPLEGYAIQVRVVCDGLEDA